MDFIWQANDFKVKNVLDIASLKQYYGQDITEPLVAIEGINVTAENVKLMSQDKNPTLKITLSNGVSLIKFKSSVEEYNNLSSTTGCVTINAVGKCAMNVFNSIVTPQILIEEYQIIKKQEYYF